MPDKSRVLDIYKLMINDGIEPEMFLALNAFRCADIFSIDEAYHLSLKAYEMFEKKFINIIDCFNTVYAYYERYGLENTLKHDFISNLE